MHKYPRRTKTRRIFALGRFLSLFHFQSGESLILLVSPLPNRWFPPLSILLSFWKGVCISPKSIAVFFFFSPQQVLSNRSEHLGNLSEGTTQACCDEGGQKLVHPWKSVLSSRRTWGGIQREVTKGSEGQVLGKLCPLKLACAFYSLVRFYCLL